MTPASEQETSRVCEHPAMNTTFAIRVPDVVASPDPGPAAAACFRELEKIESLLSRYRPESDVGRINALNAGESLFIHEDTHAILLAALELNQITAGLFDITLGRQTLALQRGGDSSSAAPVPIGGQLAVEPDRPVVACVEPGRAIDLGGIGKGFALDRMAGILLEHGVQEALLMAGASTLLAVGSHAWRIRLEVDDYRREIELAAAALSASSTGMLGAHVLQPDGRPPPSYCCPRLWLLASDATTADALSTASLLMDGASLASFVRTEPTVREVWIPVEGSIRALRNEDGMPHSGGQ